MQLPSGLLELAGAFDGYSPLYLVGGAVRNAILGLPLGDFDIASALEPYEVKRIINGTRCVITAEYPRTGTLLIKGENFAAEYTSFREDSYSGSGNHAPSNVRFTRDIVKDAMRRDFTCNAVYYHIAKERIADPLGGAGDIEKRLIRTTRGAADVMSEDALRILRMVRFRAELGFTLDEELVSVCRSLKDSLKEISRERINDEMHKIFLSQRKYYPFSEVFPSDSIRLLEEIGCLEHIFLCDLRPIDYDGVKLAEGNEIALFGTLLKSCGYENILPRLGLSNKLTRDVRAVCEAMNDTDADRTEYAIKYARVYSYMERYLDGKAPCLSEYVRGVVSRGLPTAVSMLKVNGEDARGMGLCGKDIGIALSKVLYLAVRDNIADKEGQYAVLEKAAKEES